MRSVLTYSALNTFRNCPRKYKLRYLDHLRPQAQPDSLAFGSVIHEALERWYRLPADSHRPLAILDFLDATYPNRQANEHEKARWHLARAMMTGYARRYACEPFDVLEIEKTFEGQIRNPDTGRQSQTFTMAGKVDGIVRLDGEVYLAEHKTASSLTGDYLDRLWTDTQIALYSFYLRELGYPVVGVIYNILLKARLQQRVGETEAEFEARRAALAAKNKSGKTPLALARERGLEETALLLIERGAEE